MQSNINFESVITGSTSKATVQKPSKPPFNQNTKDLRAATFYLEIANIMMREIGQFSWDKIIYIYIFFLNFVLCVTAKSGLVLLKYRKIYRFSYIA